MNTLQLPLTGGFVTPDHIAPPKDGTPIVAVGRIIYTDEWSTTVEPFCAAIHWVGKPSGFAGWCQWIGEFHLAVAESLQDKVVIDHWLPFPIERDTVCDSPEMQSGFRQTPSDTPQEK